MLKSILFTVITAAAIFSAAFVFDGGDGDAFSKNTVLFQGAQRRTCGTMENLEMQYEADPSYRLRMKELEKFAEKYSREHWNERDSRSVIIIPCVVHVVWNTPQQNISDDQILSQIDILNRDFRRLNSDTVNTPPPFKPLGADCQIEFRMARRDPANNPSLGITRTQTSITEFGQNIAVKFTALGGHDAWDRDRYLNLWTCNLGSNLLGYATFPGGNASIDGVVIGYNYFGSVGVVSPPFNKGRTATHEVGHWLWLYHIWGDDNGSCSGSDLVGDTPNQGAEFYGCPAYPSLDNCSPTVPGVMFMNYMDYTDDACMNIFTQGQLTRINAAINGPRLPLQSSNGHIDVSGLPICSFRADSITIEYNNQVHFFDVSAGIPTGWQWTFTGGSPPSSTQQNPAVTYSTPGLYTVKLRVSNTFGSDSLTRVSYIRVRGAAMAPITMIAPPSLTRVIVSANDTSRVNFIWTKASSNPTVNYKIKIRKIAAGSQEFIFTSNSGGLDTVAGLRRSFLDTLAGIMGTTGDSVRCSWRAWSYNGMDSLQSINSFLITFVRSTIGIQIISAEIPGSYALYNNYPNPFNPVTKIRFDLPGNINGKITDVKIVIFDILGQQQETIVNRQLKPGRYEADWNAENYPSGVYFYRLSVTQAGSSNMEYIDTRKMILVK